MSDVLDKPSRYLEPAKQKTSTQDYKMIHALYRLDVRPKFLLLLMVSHINPLWPPQEQRGFKTTITAKEWADSLPGTANSYRDLKAAAEGLVRLNPVQYS